MFKPHAPIFIITVFQRQQQMKYLLNCIRYIYRKVTYAFNIHKIFK